MSDEKDDKWEMPTPVFRSSTGSLPKSLEETISHSFMPNAETIEIDEDDDILSIMDTPAKPQDAEISEAPGSEKILEIGSEITPATIVHANGDESTSEAHHTPITVTAKNAIENAAPETVDAKSNFVIYILVALVVAGIIAAVIYYQP